MQFSAALPSILQLRARIAWHFAQYSNVHRLTVLCKQETPGSYGVWMAVASSLGKQGSCFPCHWLQTMRGSCTKRAVVSAFNPNPICCLVYASLNSFPNSLISILSHSMYGNKMIIGGLWSRTTYSGNVVQQ